MVAKYTIVSIIISIVAVLFCSCSDRSVVGTEQFKNSGAKLQRLGEVKAELPICNETIYCIAINEIGDIMSLETGDSIDELGIPLTKQQMEIWEMYNLIVIDVDYLGAYTDHASTTDNMIADADMIILVSGDIPVNLSCLKACAGSDNYVSCIIACMGKRPKRSCF